MKKIEIKANAKVNFTLDVIGKSKNYHEIKSLVASVNLYDEIYLRQRKDDEIFLSVIGDAGCPVSDNNAYKAAMLFKQTFLTGGCDIILHKKIPLGSGLGGSSADIAGVLNGLKLLFDIDCDMLPLANKLGSDSGYMLNGGFAVISGRGDKIKPLNTSAKFYLLVCICDNKVNTVNVYEKFDEQKQIFAEVTDIAVKNLLAGEYETFFDNLKNDLYFATKSLLPSIHKNFELLHKFAPTVMTGSGSAVFSVFLTEQERDETYEKLKNLLGTNLLKTETV